MAEATDSGPVFFTKATPEQWLFVLSQYKEVLKERAAARRTKKGGPEELIRLDTWYQEQLPKIIHSRKPPHIIHEELIQIVKWKLMRGKFRPRLTDLVRINTETAVLSISKKAFKKPPKESLSQAITALTNLKGVGPATASAILAAAFPDEVPFMADESMLSTPGIEATDYTLAEYLNYAEHIKACAERLKKLDPKSNWTPHKVELTLWTHYLARELKPSILDGMPKPTKKDASENGEHADEDSRPENGNIEEPSNESDAVTPNPQNSTDDEKELPSEENTNDSNADSGKENVGESVDSVNEDTGNSSEAAEKSPPDEPPAKRLCVEQ